MSWKNKRILITGGAGFLGRGLIERLYPDNEIVIYSRDEAKHYFVKKKYPKITCRIGDIRDFDTLNRVATGCNKAIFAASMKQIEACNDDPQEAGRTIFQGGINSKYVALGLKMESACFISSDKAVAPSTIYGGLKLAAGKSFICDNDRMDTRLSTLVYGNVLNSEKSIVPLIWDSIKCSRTLTLYSERMTRFSLTLEDAIDLILISDAHEFNRTTLVPRAKSFLVKDLFDIYAEKFGLKYILGIPRPSEKIHEVMISREEISRTNHIPRRFGYSGYCITNQESGHPKKVLENEYSSGDQENLMSRYQLESILEKYNYFEQ